MVRFLGGFFIRYLPSSNASVLNHIWRQFLEILDFRLVDSEREGERRNEVHLQEHVVPFRLEFADRLVRRWPDSIHIRELHRIDRLDHLEERA